MEKRCRELHRVLGISDKEVWKKFMKDNYTAAFLERPIKSSVQTSHSGQSTTSAESSASNLDEKAEMLQRLHNDFGESKIVTLKATEETVEMILENTAGLKATFNVKFEPKKPYLIDGLRIQVN